MYTENVRRKTLKDEIKKFLNDEIKTLKLEMRIDIITLRPNTKDVKEQTELCYSKCGPWSSSFGILRACSSCIIVRVSARSSGIMCTLRSDKGTVQRKPPK